MDIKSVAKDILGIPQFKALDKKKQKLVLGISIATAATIIGLPFSPFVYRVLVGVLSKKSPKDHSRMEEIRDKTLSSGKLSKQEKIALERRNILERHGFEVREDGKIPPMKSMQKLALYNNKTYNWILRREGQGGIWLQVNLFKDSNLEDLIEQFGTPYDSTVDVPPKFRDKINDKGFWIFPEGAAIPNEVEEDTLIAQERENGGYQLYFIRAPGLAREISILPDEEENLDEKVDLLLDPTRPISREEEYNNEDVDEDDVYVEIPMPKTETFNAGERLETLQRNLESEGFLIVENESEIPPIEVGQSIQKIAIPQGDRAFTLHKRKLGTEAISRPIFTWDNFEQVIEDFEQRDDYNTNQTRESQLRDLGFFIRDPEHEIVADRLIATEKERGKFELIFVSSSKGKIAGPVILERNGDAREAANALKAEVSRL